MKKTINILRLFGDRGLLGGVEQRVYEKEQNLRALGLSSTGYIGVNG